jgi:hypothetical protein
MAASISRYAAELDPATCACCSTGARIAQVMTSQPFTSMTGDSLSAVGYWRRLPGDSVEYLAPDASALSSNAFIRDHCFTLAGARRDRRGLVGLSFVPATERTLPDIAGTIWLDARSFELRLVEFRYTRLPAMAYAQRVGGEVHFARLASGAVDRGSLVHPDAAGRAAVRRSRSSHAALRGRRRGDHRRRATVATARQRVRHRPRQHRSPESKAPWSARSARIVRR